jgi:uncharacterized protein (UPF0332 family)
MSPRSREFLERARERINAAHALAAGTPDLAVSVAYYAMLYAARAALSEQDLYAKTHTGTWNLFHRSFVADHRFDADLLTQARAIQGRREAIDYDAAVVSSDEATAAIALADRFVNEVAVMINP